MFHILCSEMSQGYIFYICLVISKHIYKQTKSPYQCSHCYYCYLKQDFCSQNMSHTYNLVTYQHFLVLNLHCKVGLRSKIQKILHHFTECSRQHNWNTPPSSVPFSFTFRTATSIFFPPHQN